MLGSVAEAKTYLRILTSDFDGELGLKVPQASAVVLDYITIAEADLADEDLQVATAATYEVARAMMEGVEPLSPTIKNILRRLRDPSLS